MSWYRWKRWRFAWSCQREKALGVPFVDGDGVWICLYGKLHLLTERR